jgi:hypothetical protein
MVGQRATTAEELQTTVVPSVATVEAVRHLAISADGRVLYAATSGEGVFQLELW